MEAGALAKVVQDFFTVTTGEINLEKNEIVQIVECIDRIWCFARCGSKRGKVPLNNLLAIETPTVAPGQVLFVANADFNAQGDGDLMFIKGEIIIGDQQIDINWWSGHIDSYRYGIFPTSHAWQVDTSSLQKQSNSRDLRLLARVTTSMKAQIDEEMDLVKGETVLIFEQIDHDWYRGEIGDKTGIFPSSYVEILDDCSLKQISKPNTCFDIIQDRNRMLPTVSQTTNVPPSSQVVFDEMTYYNKNSYDNPMQDDFSNLSFNTKNLEMTESHTVDSKSGNTDLMTFSPEKEKYKSIPSSNWKDALSELDFLKDDYFKNNLPGLFSITNTVAESNKSLPIMSQHSASMDIIPYGITLYPFIAQFENELSFYDGEIVHLLHYIDKDWIKGEMNGKCGIFPTSYVNIVIDCDNSKVAESLSKMESTSHIETNLLPNSFAKVTYTFTAQMNGDISVVENEIVYLISQDNDDWWKVRKDNGATGLCPQNYLAPYKPGSDVFERHRHAMPARSNSLSSHLVKKEIPQHDHSQMSYKNQDQNSRAEKEQNYSMQQASQSTEVNEFVEIREHLVTVPVSKIHPPKLLDRRAMTLPRRPSPPRSPPPEPPQEEGDELSYDAHPDEVVYRRPIRPPIFEKPVVHQIYTGTPQKSSAFKRLGSDRIPHRPPPPVPAPGQVPVHRTQSQPENDKISITGETGYDASTSEETHQGVLDNAEEVLRKKGEQRQNVISELAFTENDYIRNLKIVYETFNLHNPRHLEERGIDSATLFGNLLEVIRTAENFLDRIRMAMKSKSDEDQFIGPCFLEMADELRTVYGHYCVNHEDALALLEKYDVDQDIKRFFYKGLETLRLQIACFDMTSILIKPVQRIMKYPLILNELIKCTEDSHKDKAHLLLAVRKMSDVASLINESKRRRDLVAKYLEDANTGLTTKMSRFSLHSVAKKSTRLGTKLTSSLGIGTIIRDPAFVELEQMFHILVKTIRQFVRNVAVFVANLKSVVISQLHCAEAIVEFYSENKEVANVDEFRMSQHTLLADTFTSFQKYIENRVLHPLHTVIEFSEGPSRLIQKRNDKLLDYESCLSKAERNIKELKTQVDLAKHNYEALNSQLLEELPIFISHVSSVYAECISNFISTRKLFSGRVTQHYLELTKLPVMIGCTGDVMEMFKVKHNLVCSELGNFSFSSKHFKQENTMKRNSKLSLSPNVIQKEGTKTMQSPSKKAYVLSKYPQDKLYVVTDNYVSSELMELSVEKSNVVGVIKKQDPMGKTERWYIDDGEQQGFLPRMYLSPLQDNPSSSQSYSLHPIRHESSNTVPKYMTKQVSVSPKPDVESSLIEDTPPTYDEVFNENLSPSKSLNADISNNQSHVYEDIPEMEFCYAAYEFNTSGDNLLPLKVGQVIKVIRKHDVEGNTEWWLVEDRFGVQGYVPGNYLAKYIEK